MSDGNLDLTILKLKEDIKGINEEMKTFKQITNTTIRELMTVVKALMEEKETQAKEYEGFKKNINDKIEKLLKDFPEKLKEFKDNGNSTSIASVPTYNKEDLPFLHFCIGRDKGCTHKGGAIYGNNPYTDDSNLCTAALHSGLIGYEGGFYLVKHTGSRNNYMSTTNNGITSNSYNTWNSITLYPFSGSFSGDFPCGKVNSVL